MAQIESIQVNIETGDESGGGTDGSIYVGVGGREFHLDTSADDFERGSATNTCWVRAATSSTRR